MSTIFIAASVARQVEGEYVFVKLEKASFDKEKIYSYINPLPAIEAQQIDGIPCIVERSVLEVKVE